MRWTVIEHAGTPVSAGASAWLAAPGGTIGRSPDNHLVLPDAQRQISRLQATVRFDEDGAAVLRNMSAVLPIGVNGRTLAHEQESRVADGDRVTIGSYVLQTRSAQHSVNVAPTVMEAPAAAPSAAVPPLPSPSPVPPPQAAPPPAAALQPLSPAAAAAPLQPSPIGDLLPPSPGADVFADLFGEGTLPIGEAQPGSVMPQPQRVAEPAPAPAPAPAQVSMPTPVPPPAPAFVPPLAPPPAPFAAPLQPPAAPPSANTSNSAAASQMPSAADWDAILANAPRRVDSTPAPMPDPMAHEPFDLPSQARRNPVDPLAELNPHAADDMANIALKRGVDPLSFFASDDSAHAPLADPRPTALTHHDPMLPGDAHPALDLLHERQPAVHAYSPSNHAREVATQFRPPTPMAAPAPAVPVVPVVPVVTVVPAMPVEVEAPSPPPPAPPPPPSAPPPAPPPVVAAPVVAPPVAATPPDVVAQPEAPVAPMVPAMPVMPVEAPVTATPSAPAAPTAAPSAAAPAAPLSPSTAEAMFKAFLEGAGVPELAGQQPMDAEAMQRLGRIMRAFTDGTIELLSSRAMLKREVRAEITMIVDEENNPFKILPNGRAVLMQMFGARMPGFLPPEAAVHDALGDLQSHQLGMVAGMRAALLTLLKSFDPAALARDTPHDGGLGEKLLPGGREARLWRRLQALHTETTAAVEDDFQAVFGRAFQQAYDKEMERLKEARRA